MPDEGSCERPGHDHPGRSLVEGMGRRDGPGCGPAGIGSTPPSPPMIGSIWSSRAWRVRRATAETPRGTRVSNPTRTGVESCPAVSPGTTPRTQAVITTVYSVLMLQACVLGVVPGKPLYEAFVSGPMKGSDVGWAGSMAECADVLEGAELVSEGSVLARPRGSPEPGPSRGRFGRREPWRD